MGSVFGAMVAPVQHLLDAVVTFPGAMYTVLLGVVLLYWASMLAGAVDLDLLGGAEHGGADGAAEGAMHGGGAADAHGGHDVDGGDGDGDGGDADGDGADGEGDGGVLSALGALGLRKLPMTVSVSLLVIWGWLISVLGTVTLAEPAARYLPPGVFRALLFVVAALASLKLAGVSARPIAPLFVANKASRREHLVGKTAEVSTGRLDAGFGQVLVGDGGAGLLIDARYEGGAALKRGDRVVVSSWDAEKGYVLVEPLDRFTALRVDAAAKPESAAAKAPAATDEAAAKSGDDASKRVLR
ncbi:MAG: hypothetical protein JWM10_255 [Myxococcaceae bacterium]|nr:hypothetical protein [Myxococcaceae bacterium]